MVKKGSAQKKAPDPFLLIQNERSYIKAKE